MVYSVETRRALNGFGHDDSDLVWLTRVVHPDLDVGFPSRGHALKDCPSVDVLYREDSRPELDAAIEDELRWMILSRLSEVHSSGAII